jgi:hypothetical protein
VDWIVVGCGSGQRLVVTLILDVTRMWRVLNTIWSGGVRCGRQLLRGGWWRGGVCARWRLKQPLGRHFSDGCGAADKCFPEFIEANRDNAFHFLHWTRHQGACHLFIYQVFVLRSKSLELGFGSYDDDVSDVISFLEVSPWRHWLSLMGGFYCSNEQLYGRSCSCVFVWQGSTYT